jgi:hypothetical protein
VVIEIPILFGEIFDIRTHNDYAATWTEQSHNFSEHGVAALARAKVLKKIGDEYDVNTSVSDRLHALCAAFVKLDIRTDVIACVWIGVDSNFFSRHNLVNELAIAACQIKNDAIAANKRLKEVLAENGPNLRLFALICFRKAVTVKFG